MNKKLLVSCIVTTKNEAKNIENCLRSLKKQTYKQIEIIVVDNQSSDNTKKIARKYTDKVFNKGPERSSQRNFGAKKAKGIYLLFLDADMVLSPKVVASCVSLIQQKKNILALVIPEESYGEGFWSQCKKLERSFYLEVDWMEAARFYKKKVFKELKGYDEKQTGTEDFDLPQRLKYSFGNDSIGRINEFIFHNEGQFSLRKTMKKKYYYAKTITAYTRKKSNKKGFKKQASIIARYKLFLGKPQLLLRNPVYGVGMLFMKTAEFGSGSLGYLLNKIQK